MIYLFDLITQINIKTWRLWNIAFFYLSMKQKKIFWPGYLHVTLLYMILSMTHLKWMKHHGLCQVFNIVFWGMPVVWLIIPLFETIFWSVKQKCLYFCTPWIFAHPACRKGSKYVLVSAEWVCKNKWMYQM